MKLRAGAYITDPGPPRVDLNAENFYVDQPRKVKLYAKVGLFGSKSKDQPEPEGKVSFFRVKLKAAQFVERFEPDYGEADELEERKRKGANLWWYSTHDDDDDDVEEVDA